MQDQAIYDRLTELFADLFPMDEIALTPQTTAKDIEGWDSFNHISIMVAIESRFAIRLTSTEFDALANIGALVRLIQSKLPG